jgi:mono/diheme cytochrome c family protein
MTRRPLIGIVSSCCLAACLFGVAQGKQTPAQDKAGAKAAKPPAVAISEGEKRFRTHCGRCHNPPDNISPREARAVVRQMRVRAMLSAEDQRLILEYLAP